MAVNPIIAAIRAAALSRGVDPAAALSVASMEGLGGGIGDNGTSFGPFQLHYGGAMPGGIANPQQWAMSQAGINYAMNHIASVAKGLHGNAAIAAIVRQFERPANPEREIAGALSKYGQFWAGPSAPPVLKPNPQTPVLRALAGAGAPSKQPNYIGDMLQTLKLAGFDTSPYQGFGALAAPTPVPTFGKPLPGKVLPSAPAPRNPQEYKNAKTVAGYPAQQGHYQFLAPEANVNIGHVNPKLLMAVNALGHYLGVPITVTSGFRSYQQQQALYQRYVNSGYNNAYIAAKPGQSNHEGGNAVDLVINGVPIAKAVPADVLARFGLHNPVNGDLPHTTLLSVRG